MIKTDAILLKAQDSGDSDKLVWLLTADRGLIVAKMRGVKKAGAKLKGSAQPFCFGKYQLISKAGFFTITGCDIIDGFFAVAHDPDKYILGNLMLEIACESGRYGDNVLAVLLSALKDLVYSDTDPYNAAINFVTAILAVLGYRVDIDSVSNPKIKAGLIAIGKGENIPREVSVAVLKYLVTHTQNRLMHKINALNMLD